MFARTRYASGSPFTARAGFKFLPFMEWSFELLAFEIFARHRYALLNVTLWRAEAVENLNEKMLCPLFRASCCFRFCHVSI